METEGGGKDEGEGETDDPDAAEVHEAWHECLARTDEDAIGYDAGCEHGFGPCLNAQDVGAEMYDFCVLGDELHHLGGEYSHEYAHDSHDADAERDGYPCEAAHEILSLGSKALADEGGGCFCYSVARHVAEAFDVDAEGVGCYCHCSEGGNDASDGNLCSAHDTALEAYREGYLACPDQSGACGDVEANGVCVGSGCIEHEFQLLVFLDDVVEHESHGDDVGKEGAVGCATSAEVEDEDEEIVEDDIKEAHHSAEEP